MTDLLTPAEVCAWLRVKAGTLAAWTSRGSIPCVRLAARSPRYSRAALEAWLSERTASPVGDELGARRRRGGGGS